MFIYNFIVFDVVKGFLNVKWCQLRSRKTTLITLFEKMRDHQTEQLMKDINAAIPDNIRIVRDEDIERSVNR